MEGQRSAEKEVKQANAIMKRRSDLQTSHPSIHPSIHSVTPSPVFLPSHNSPSPPPPPCPSLTHPLLFLSPATSDDHFHQGSLDAAMRERVFARGQRHPSPPGCHAVQNETLLTRVYGISPSSLRRPTDQPISSIIDNTSIRRAMQS